MQYTETDCDANVILYVAPPGYFFVGLFTLIVLIIGMNIGVWIERNRE
jgi:hypothetical protein